MGRHLPPTTFHALLGRAAEGDRVARAELRDAVGAGRLSDTQSAELEALLADLAPDDPDDDWRSGLLQPDFWLDYDPTTTPKKKP